MDIIGKKNIYFAISLLVLIPGIIAIFLWGLSLSIDFTGGSSIGIEVPQNFSSKDEAMVIKALEKRGVKIGSVEKGDRAIFLRTSEVSDKTHKEFIQEIEKADLKEQEFETIGPSIGRETTVNTLKALVLASFLIVIYITWSFRKVPKPASPFRFGVCAIVALLHDAFVVIGVFAILGHFLGVEVDAMFVTALLTVIGFSVHDTIVVFDRIRENLRRTPSVQFDKLVNASILQTLGRSLNTSLTVILVLVSLLLFGGESIRWFVVALLVGIISGTYSSIFNASPLLVVWHEWSSKRRK